MKKNKITSYFVLVSFLTFITIFSFIVQRSYFNFKKPQKLVENNAILKEINPNLDLSIISTIELKNKNTEEPFDFSIIKSGKVLEDVSAPTPIPSIVVQPTASPITVTPTETLTETTP
jgi:hypothetical protein